ncbi:MAG: RNA pseudouridine synthase, partial [Cyanobium sp.]
MPEPDGWLPPAWNTGWDYRDRIGPAEAGLTVLGFYAGRYRHSDRATWARRLAAGEIQLAGELLSA